MHLLVLKKNLWLSLYELSLCEFQREGCQSFNQIRVGFAPRFHHLQCTMRVSLVAWPNGSVSGTRALLIMCWLSPQIRSILRFVGSQLSPPGFVSRLHRPEKIERLRTVSVYCVMISRRVLEGALWYRVLIDPSPPCSALSQRCCLSTGPRSPITVSLQQPKQSFSGSCGRSGCRGHPSPSARPRRA